MTVKAFVLIETWIGKTEQVVEAVRKLEGIASVDVVNGPYDAIAIVHGETLNHIGKLVTERLCNISGVSGTVTCLSVL